MELIAGAKAHYLAAVSLFMAHNDVRYYLNGISIEPASQGGVLLIATNGHHIGVMHDPDGWASNKIIISPSKALVAGLKKRNAGTAFIYRGSAPNLVLRQADPNSLIRCTFPGHEHLQNFFAGVMPRRADHEERYDGLPDFLGLKAKKVA
ncbi:TPA: hypothetical protein ACRNK2_004981 [Pseudomonas aeruginosa]|nr:hypothetical protein [Pseudomonas aeruginosa]MBI7204382.1 hypothetical protein [Pseudomonas aeruginosa]